MRSTARCERATGHPEFHAGRTPRGIWKFWWQSYRVDRDQPVATLGGMNSDTATERITRLAQEIAALRLGLKAEESNLADHPTYVRARKYREQDSARINGMVIALTFMLGCPRDMAAAEAFIRGVTAAPSAANASAPAV